MCTSGGQCIHISAAKRGCHRQGKRIHTPFCSDQAGRWTVGAATPRWPRCACWAWTSAARWNALTWCPSSGAARRAARPPGTGAVHACLADRMLACAPLARQQPAAAVAHASGGGGRRRARRASDAAALMGVQTYEGGLGGEPGTEAHGGYTFCGLAALHLAGRAGALNLPALLHWAVHRQVRGAAPLASHISACCSRAQLGSPQDLLDSAWHAHQPGRRAPQPWCCGRRRGHQRVSVRGSSSSGNSQPGLPLWVVASRA